MEKENKIYILTVLSVIFVPAAYIFAAAVFIVQMIKGETAVFRLVRINKLFLLWFLYILIGVVFSHDRFISSAYGILMLLCLYMSGFVCLYVRENNFEKIKKLLYVISVIVFVFGIIQFLSPHFTVPGKWVDSSEYHLNKRVYSTFFNPNVFGFYINIILILDCRDIGVKGAGLETSVFILGLVCLYLTFSRTAWIALIISLSFTGLFFDRKYLIYAALTAAVLICADIFFGIDRLNIAKAAEDTSVMYRIEVWKTSLKIFKDNYLTGIGFGTLFQFVSKYSTTVKSNIEHCHNFYIQIVTETGLTGICLASFFIKNFVKMLKISAEQNKGEIWITFYTVTVMIFIHGMADSVLFTPQAMLIVGIYFGMMVNQVYWSQKETDFAALNGIAEKSM